MTSLGEIIEKVIFDIQVENSLKTLTTNYRPNEPYAYLLGCLEMPKAYVYEFIHDAAAESTTSIADPNTDYFIKAYNFKKHMLPETRLDYLSWFHAHPIDRPSIHTDIPSQKRFRKIYSPSFATIMDNRTLEMTCFDVDDNGKVIIIPHEVRSIPQEIRRMT